MTAKTYLGNLIFRHKFVDDEKGRGNYYTAGKGNFSFYMPSYVMDDIDEILDENKNNYKLSRSEIIFIALKDFVYNYKQYLNNKKSNTKP